MTMSRLNAIKHTPNRKALPLTEVCQLTLSTPCHCSHLNPVDCSK